MPGIPVSTASTAIARQFHHDARQAPRHAQGAFLDRCGFSRNSLKHTVLSVGLLVAGACGVLGTASGAMVQGAMAKDLGDRFPATAPSAAAQPAKNAGGLIVSMANVTADKGNMLDRLLAAQNVPADNRRAVLAALSDMIDPASLPAGSRLRLTFAPADDATAGSATRLVQTVEVTTGDTTSLMVHIDAARPVSDQDVAKALQARSGTSGGKASIWIVNQKPADQQPDGQQAATGGSTTDRSQAASLGTPAESGQADSAEGDGQFVVQHVTGTVGKNLRAALIAKGLPAAVADEIVLGFKAGPGRLPALHAAATFEVIYEGLQRGSKLDDPQLRYAMLDDGGKTQRIYRYQTDEQTTTLMQEDGHGVALVDLGKPLQIDARITSPYGWRIHPVFGDRRFHEGVDFGAPTGTPVVATSDGVVEDIGWRGNYGKYVRLRHDGHLATAYAHLSGFARGLQRGSTVKRGDIIAYVGRSGVATGPHLYYEVLVDGKQIDPMKSIPGEPVSLTGQQLAEFQKYVETAPEE